MTIEQRTKRIFDLLMASFLLLVFAPLLLAVTLMILVFEGRPVFYISRRFVSPGKTIPVIKFRTMVRDAKSPKYRLPERFMRDGYLDIPRTCEVYTPLGRFLERTQIVELPQMLNVIFHGMSLIGNRPLPADNVKLLRKHPAWSRRFESPAGVTGIAQVIGKLQLTPQQRLHFENAYSDLYRRGGVLACDVRIFLATVKVILFSRGLQLQDAYALMKTTEIEVPNHAATPPRNILVLGASSAIGGEIAAAFAPGNNLLLVGRNEVKLEDAAQRCILARANRVVRFPADLSGSNTEVIRAATKWDVDLIINAASATSRLLDTDVDIDAFSQYVAVDLLAPIELIRALLSACGDRVVNVVYVSTILAVVRSPRRVIYSSLKVLHERALQKLAGARPRMRLMVVRVATVIPADRRSRQAEKLGMAVRRSFDRGRHVLLFGTTGRLLRLLYYTQPLVFGLVVELRRKVRIQGRPASAAVQEWM